MALKDLSAAELTATPREIDEAIRWAISAAEHEARRVIMRDAGLSRETAKSLEAAYRARARALSVVRDKVLDRK